MDPSPKALKEYGVVEREQVVAPMVEHLQRCRHTSLPSRTR
jgi:hypothetical protein